MNAQLLAEELDRLGEQLHQVEDIMHRPETGCMSPEVDRLRDEIIDITLKMDQIKEELGLCIEQEY